MSWPVLISSRAQKDFRSIFAYIENRSPDGAVRWRAAFQEGLRRVSEDPRRFGYAPENEQTRSELRQLLFKTRRGLTYRAVFTVVDNEVHILRIRGPGQPPLTSDETPSG